MNNIEELKRFIYSATVTSGSGSQSFYIDAESREEADARAANNESDGMYADDSEITDLDALEYEDETTVDDFGDFPLISREQSLIAQLEAAHKRIAELDNSESQLINERDHAESTINSMFVAVMSEKPEWSNMYQFIDAVDEVEDFVSILKQRAESAEAALSAANEKLSKPVVLPIKYNPAAAGNKSTRANFIWHNDAISYCADAIKAAGFTVEE
ncbi:hypothetical protein J8Z85_08685 [Yersinia enterocolitica]|uniref:hypothetical protein n=1 Tax=Yersinia enterocolitica TaxID=630 RepID=UPI001C8DCBE8|nr:hypothetical protein [Yersinia enterocolitica]MBX9479189.1 hypothetical protein [Yersinia enterocolitica]